MIKTLYKDGGLEKLNNKTKALSISIVVGLTGLGLSLAFLIRLFAPNMALSSLVKDYPNAYLYISIIIGIISFVLMFYILHKPLFKLQDQSLTYYDGLLSSHTYSLEELSSIQISSDDETVTMDIRNSSGLNNRIEMKTVNGLGQSIFTFLTQNTKIKVIQHDT